MILKSIKQNFKNPLNLIALVLVPIAWYLGTATVRSNIAFLNNTSLAGQNEEAAAVFAAQRAAINGYMVFAEGASEFYISLVSVLLVGVLFSAGFTYDKNSGFGCYCITRKNFLNYFFSKVWSVFLCGFTVTAVPLCLAFIYSLVKYSATLPTDAFNFSMVGKTAEMFFDKPVFSCLFIIFSISLYTALLALMGMGVSAFTSNRFLVSVAPFAIYLLGTIIPQLSYIDSALGHILCWIFPPHFTGMFIQNSFGYTGNLSLFAIWAVHLTVVIIPTILLLTVLYIKNKRQYIR